MALARIGHVFEMPTEWSREVVLQLVWGGRVVVVRLQWVGIGQGWVVTSEWM